MIFYRRIFAIIFALIFFLSPLILLAATANPEDNLQCWVQSACEKKDEKGNKTGQWDRKSDRAIETCGGGTYGFCYPPFRDIEIGIGIPVKGEVKTKVKDLGGYINTMYLFLLSTAALIATVMVMVSGTQYVAASGSGDVGKAKERIKNAVTGLILLMFAAVILFTVNPQLLQLKVPQMPRIRQIVYVSDQTPCEWFVSNGYTVDPLHQKSELSCGKKSDVKKDPQLNELKDTSCIWSGCGTGANKTFNGVIMDKSCLKVEGNYACIGCWEITTGPPFDTGVQPGSDVCASMSPKQDMVNTGNHLTCEFSRDMGFERTEFADAKVTGQCAALGYKCADIKKCEDYDQILVQNNDGQQKLYAFEAPGFSFDYSVHKRICEENLCGVSTGCQQDIKVDSPASDYYTMYATAGASFVVESAISALTGDEITGISCVSK
jgi:hypothetical protein